jgi:hypothetical protein
MAFGLFVRWAARWFARRPSGTRAFVLLGALGPAILIIRNHANVASGTLTQVFVIALLLHFVLGSEPAEAEGPAIQPTPLGSGAAAGSGPGGSLSGPYPVP